MDELDLFNATQYTFKNHDELLRSDICGCCYCLKIYPPEEIVTWEQDPRSDVESGQTGLCPHCGIDSIIGSASGIPVHVDILNTLHRLFFNDRSQHFSLFRPVGPIELKLIEESGWRRFPPRLPEQPIFYPVLTLEYARQIARKWNVAQSGSGYVMEFFLDREYARKFRVKIVGSAIHQELWVPADELDDFNNNIFGQIELIESYNADANRL